MKDGRETAVAKMGLGNASEWNDDKRTIKLNTEKIRHSPIWSRQM